MNDLSARAFAGLGRKDQPTAAQVATFAELAVPSIDLTIASIEALDEPKALTKDVAKWIALARQANASTRAALPETDAQFAKVNKFGKRLGVVCGN